MTTLSPDSALVLFSGGQDSTTCLAWALERYSRVETIGFRYGQRHLIEMDVRQPIRERLAALKPDWATRLSQDRELDLDILGKVSVSALTADLPFRPPPRTACPAPSCPAATSSSSPSPPLSPTSAASSTSSPASARPITAATPTAATTRSRRCRRRSTSACSRAWSCTRR